MFSLLLGLSTLSASAHDQNCRQAAATIRASALQNNADAFVYLLVGPPNAGKGTAGKPFAKELGIPYQSTGDALRAVIDSGSDLGKKIEPIMRAGRNIDTADLMPVLKQWLGSLDPKKGFILDGSPRKLNEAKDLEKMIMARGWKGIRVIYFEVSEDVVFERAAGRRICSSKICGQSYHDRFLVPQTAGLCDLCGSFLKRRSDDESPEIVRQRLETFEIETRPVLDYFESKSMLIRLNANASQGSVLEEIWRALLRP